MEKEMKQKKEEVKKLETKIPQNKEEKLDFLIKNTIELQKIITDLALDVNSLAKDMKTMLELFNEAKKSFDEGKTGGIPAGGDINAKIDRLMEQNKVVARGIVLLESFLKEKTEQASAAFRPKPLPEYR